jgi:outer membrane protein assembly factor BamA
MSARATAEHASGFTFSDYRYNRVVVEAAYFHPVLSGAVLAFHARSGWVQALGSSQGALGVDAQGRSILHPRKRLFAGGSQSVRGFGEAQLGPRILTIPAEQLADAGCNVQSDPPVCDQALLTNKELLPDNAFSARPLGGNLLVEGSLEVRIPIFRNFGGALFVDAGLVGESGLSDLRQSTIAVTPGFGFRYASPAGPIRIDFGLNPFLTEDLPVVTEIEDEGTGNRIVGLATVRPSDGVQVAARRTYTEPRVGGFLGFLGRFTLHLSIGEAF